MSAGRDRAVEAERDGASGPQPLASARPGIRREPTIRTVQRTAGNRAATRLVDAARPSVDDVRPLASGLRDRLEQRLGADLSRVRVHEGHEASRETERRGAVAFTRGRDVFLSATVEPDDPRVLAHEAAHAVQQAAAGTHDAPAALEAEAQAVGAGGSTVAGSAPFGAIQKLDAPEPPLTEQEVRWAFDWLLPRLGPDKSWKENIGGEQTARVMRLHSGVAHRFAGDAEFREWRRAGGKPQAVAPVQPWGGGGGAGKTAETAETTETAVEEPGATGGGREQVPAGTVQIQPSNVDVSFDEAGSRWVVTVDGRPAAAVEVPSKDARVDINVTTDDRGHVAIEVSDVGKLVPLIPVAAEAGGPAPTEQGAGTSEFRGYTRSEVAPLLVEGARRPKTQEELFKENWERNTTREQKEEAARLGEPPIYYTKEMRELDAPPEVFEALDMFLPFPAFTSGWRGAEALSGETLSGVPVDQGAAAKSIATDILMSIVLDKIGGEIIGRVFPADEIVEAGLRGGDDLVDDAVRRSTTLADVPPVRHAGVSPAARPPTPKPKASAPTPATVPPVTTAPAAPPAPHPAAPQPKAPAPTPANVPPAKTAPVAPAAPSATTSQPQAVVVPSQSLGPTPAASTPGTTSAGLVPPTAAAPAPAPAQKPWHAPDLTPDEVLEGYRKAGVKDPLSAKRVRAKAKEGYRFDPGKRRWTKPNKPVKLPGVEQEAGRLQEKVFAEITGWPKNNTPHPTRFGNRTPDYLVKRDPATGNWVTASSPADAQVIADSKYYDATVVQLDDQIKGFVQMARRTNVPGQKTLLLMTNENAKIADAVHRYAAKQQPKVVVRQIKQLRSR